MVYVSKDPPASTSLNWFGTQEIEGSFDNSAPLK
jgi:hypothetical protein